MSGDVEPSAGAVESGHAEFCDRGRGDTVPALRRGGFRRVDRLPEVPNGHWRERDPRERDAGEFASLTLGERRAVTEHSRSTWAGTLIAHVGATATADAIAAVQHAQQHADVLAAITPYFFAAAPEAGIEQFFRQVLAASGKPWLLYNFPRHTANPLFPPWWRGWPQISRK
ncbi:dihydrodipicolinate synthase family protein [Nocardia abscessus]|nr:dihydrodipicolinate synthase family protein [Nocardia abscessus]MBF6339801.1 dihydrodipicolinate synthase family protein [Nocardia abscessus]